MGVTDLQARGNFPKNFAVLLVLIWGKEWLSAVTAFCRVEAA